MRSAGFGSLIYEICYHNPRCDHTLAPNAESRRRKAAQKADQGGKKLLQVNEIVRRINQIDSDNKRDEAQEVNEEPQKEGKGNVSPEEVARFLASNIGYDQFNLPRGPGIGPVTINEFFRELSEQSSKPLRVKTISMPESAEKWCDFVEWRRERRPENWALWGLVEDGVENTSSR